MAEDTIQTVRQAELDAARLERETVEKADHMLAQARQDVAQSLVRLKEDFAKEEEAALKEASGQSEAMLREAVANTEKCIVDLRLHAETKKAEAIRQIISELLA
ncbi:hypothetical protein U6B65_07980 [Oscillospiraceae bacterium MB08-C2-2]|nr:hypothetical protein U6B65_07980 [Oscillospiraceae bacterium MB08-C2-2]